MVCALALEIGRMTQVWLRIQAASVVGCLFVFEIWIALNGNIAFVTNSNASVSVTTLKVNKWMLVSGMVPTLVLKLVNLKVRFTMSIYRPSRYCVSNWYYISGWVLCWHTQRLINVTREKRTNLDDFRRLKGLYKIMLVVITNVQ